MRARWKVCKAREWAILPEAPWTVLRPIYEPDDGCIWASHSHWATHAEAIAAADHAARVGS